VEVLSQNFRSSLIKRDSDSSFAAIATKQNAVIPEEKEEEETTEALAKCTRETGVARSVEDPSRNFRSNRTRVALDSSFAAIATEQNADKKKKNKNHPSFEGVFCFFKRQKIKDIYYNFVR